jgi:hypothetical protein
MEAVVELLQRLPAEGYEHRVLRLSQIRGARLHRVGLQILDRGSLAPLRRRPGVDPELPAQLRERNLPLSGHRVAIPCWVMDRCIAALTACVDDALP